MHMTDMFINDETSERIAFDLYLIIITQLNFPKYGTNIKVATKWLKTESGELRRKALCIRKLKVSILHFDQESSARDR